MGRSNTEHVFPTEMAHKTYLANIISSTFFAIRKEMSYEVRESDLKYVLDSGQSYLFFLEQYCS